MPSIRMLWDATKESIDDGMRWKIKYILLMDF